MRTIRLLPRLVLLAQLAAGCAYVDYQQWNLYPTASPNNALVYIYRKPFPLWWGGYPVGTGDREIGALVEGSYFFVSFPPGRRTFWVETNTRDQITLDLAAGQVYYLRNHTELGILVPRPYIRQIKEKEGSREVRGMRYALPQ